jgi:pyruvate dehydrogenase E1 component alpha subunit
MPNARVDGMDLFAVQAQAKEMIEAIRAGSGPQFLEVMTYRFRGHSMGDPERYRKQEEVHKWQENDPIGIFRKKLLEKGIATEEELNANDTEGGKIVEDAVQFAENSPEPTLEDLYSDIYVSEQC